MANQQLASYINDQIKKGYARDAIRSALLQYGYAPEDVENALKDVPHSKHTIIFIALAILITGFAFFFFLRENNQIAEPIHLTMSIATTKATIKPGDDLSFTLSIDADQTSEGSVRYSVSDAAKDIVSKEEKIQISTKTTKKDSIPIPHTIPEGSYKLAANINVNEVEFSSQAPFDVAAAENTLKNVEEVEEKLKLSDEQQIKDIILLAKENPQSAREFCIEFANQNIADRCLLETGLTVYKNIFCHDIKNSNKRDTCYFNIVLINGEHNLCERIADSGLQGTCNKIGTPAP